MGADELIDAYLYEMRSALSGNEAARDRVVAETEDHLWEAWERYLADGLSSEDSARAAIARFGAAREIASEFPLESGGRSVARWYLGAATLLGSLLVTLGLAALITAPVHALLGPDFIFGPGGRWDAPGPFCERRGWTDCQSAWDSFFLVRTLGFGTALMLFGGMVVAGHVLVQRYVLGGVPRGVLIAGMYAFGLVAFALLTGGSLKYAFGPESGWNTWLPAGIAAAVMSGAYAFAARGTERCHSILAS